MLTQEIFIALCMVFMGYVSRANTGNCQEYCRAGKCAEDGFCEECADGYYGIRCNIPCPPNCTDRACFRFNASCSKGCKSGQYGTTCQASCRCPSGVCGRLNGTCFGLSVTCTHAVRQTCLDGKCGLLKNEYGCLGCRAGRTSRLCDEKCKENCTVCEQFANICTECKTGFYGETCEKHCDRCNGQCGKTDGMCKYGCIGGYYTELCEKPCNPNCKSQSRALPWCNQTNGACLSGCKYGFYGIFCNNTCSKNCAFSSKYNSCQQICKGKIHPERRLLGVNDSEHGEDLDWEQSEDGPKPSRMLIGLLLAGAGLVALLLIVTWLVIAPKKKRKRRSAYRRRSRQSQESVCCCCRCTHCHRSVMPPVRCQPRPCSGRRRQLSFVNSGSTNRGRAWWMRTPHIPRSDTINDSIEDNTYEEVGPPAPSVV